MRSFLLLIFLLIIPFLLVAQQKPHYSQYVINNYLLNPAITGIEDYADIKMGSRNQWVGIKGAPVTYYLSGHVKVGSPVNANTFGGAGNKPAAFGLDERQQGRYRKVKAQHGLGAILLSDRIGPFRRTEMSVSYAYHLPLTKTLKLASGASAGVISQALRPDDLSFANPDVAAAGWSKMSPNLSMGLWLYSSNFYAGASATQLFANVIPPDSYHAGENKLANHYFFTGAYKFAPTEFIAFVPSVLVKMVQPLPLSVDYNLRMIYADRLWTGMSLRPGDSYIFLAGIAINHLIDISYAYDIGMNSLNSTSRGSHEVVLGMRLNNRNKVICPQNLW